MDSKAVATERSFKGKCTLGVPALCLTPLRERTVNHASSSLSKQYEIPDSPEIDAKCLLVATIRDRCTNDAKIHDWKS